MKAKDKKLAIKVFNHFFKKANITSLEICFYKYYEWYVDVKTAMYGNIHLFTNNLMYNDDDVCKLKMFNKSRFLLSKIPKELKVNLIEHCISNDASLFIPFSILENIITIIPQASSLEELAIKMELES